MIRWRRVARRPAMAGLPYNSRQGAASTAARMRQRRDKPQSCIDIAAAGWLVFRPAGYPGLCFRGRFAASSHGGYRPHAPAW